MTHTGEKTYIMCVVRDAVIVHIFTFIRESIQEESPINVMSVVRTSSSHLGTQERGHIV